MDPVGEFVACSSIRLFLMMENRLLREALIRLFRKRSDLVVVGQDGQADPTASQLLETQFDVLLIDSFQSTWPVAKTAREAGGGTAYKAVLIGMEPDEELFMAAIRAGVMGYLLKDASASDLVAAVRAVNRGEAVCPPQLCSRLFRFVAQMVNEIPVKRPARRPDLTLRQQQLVALVSKRLLDLASRPLERAGLGLIAEGLSEFLGLGEDLSDCLVDSAWFRGHEKTHPPRFCAGGVLCAWGLCACWREEVKARTVGLVGGSFWPVTARPWTSAWT